MSIEEAIDSLKSEYRKKEDNCTVLLNSLNEEIRQGRRIGKDYTQLRKEQARLSAQKQAYVQAFYDIDSLLDHVTGEDLEDD